ncbi:hypothetical protein SDC9_202973 [bioreactor metagenome]|uniref:Uncharacterized protein n=1 Tax=bioreactor metagenome TaxID=1076179 RepID=A0A645IVD1_9ZZZZ
MRLDGNPVVDAENEFPTLVFRLDDENRFVLGASRGHGKQFRSIKMRRSENHLRIFRLPFNPE